MPSFLHKTLRKSSYILNVLEGCWLPNIENTQFVFNYGTSLEIFKFQPPSLLESVYYQPFFDRVRFICSSLQTSERSVFYALRENDVIEYKYQELEGFFVAINQFILPISCNNPTFAVYAQGHLIVSSTNGSICTIDLSNKQIINVKPSECILHSFAFSSKQFILRVESGPKISIYSIPEINLVKSAPFQNIKYSFPYRDGSYVIFQATGSSINKYGELENNSTIDSDSVEFNNTFPNFSIIFPNGLTQTIEYPKEYLSNNEQIIDYTVISSSSTIILTENGHLLQLVDDKFEYIGNFEHSYRIFALNATEILIARHGLDHVIFDLLEKDVVCTKESFSPVLNFTFFGENNRDIQYNKQNILMDNGDKNSNNDDDFNNVNQNNNNLLNNKTHEKYYEPYNRSLLTMTNSSFISSRYGYEVEKLSSFDTGENEISGLFSFSHMIYGKTVYAISFSRGFTQVLELSEDGSKIGVLNDPIIRTDICSIGFCSLDPYFLFQFYKDGFIMYSQTNQRDKQFKDLTIVNFTSTKNELFIIFSNQKGLYIITEKSELHLSAIFDLPFEATSVAFIDDTDYAIFATKDQMLYIADVTMDVQNIHFTQMSKVPSVPVSLQFTYKKKLLIGFEDGTVAAGSVDVVSKMMRDTVLISIGNLPVRFSSDDFMLSSRMYKIPKENDIVNMFQLNNDINPEYAVAMYFDQYLMATKYKVYAMKIKGKDPKMQNIRYEIKDTIIECIPIKNINFNSILVIASNKDISIFDLENLTIYAIFQYDESERFVLMSPINDDHTQICVVTQVEQTSSIRMINFINVTNNQFDSTKKCNCDVSLDLNISGKIGSICGFKGGILIGVNNSILFYKKNENDGCYRILSRTSEIGTEIVSIIANNDLIFVGDRNLSVLILEYVERFQNFRVVGQETALRRILSLTTYKSSVVGSDIDGNVFTFDDLSKIVSDLSSSFAMFKGNRRLPLKMCYNVGEVVTKVLAIKDSDDKMEKVAYATINGGFGAFLEKDKNNSFSYIMDLEGKFKTLLALQAIIEMQLLKVAAIDHFAFRNKMYPSEVVLDLDIVNLYHNFSINKKERVAKEVSSSLDTSKIETLINLFNQFFCSIC
ncbi:hypothetical protein M9Y10_028487 [Tritrichomonas musculus]|uniref:DNA damage-binding protein 1 n=1 Tax=Tritrichomonas musculus TaxID=1915356 RepID=A0ABR2KJF0_9EUKA